MAKTRKRSSDSKMTKTDKKKRSSNDKLESSETKRRPKKSRRRDDGRRSKRKERQYTSARDWANQETSSQFSSPSLDLPDGVELYRLQEPGTIYLDILPYEVGENNPRADQGMFHFERTFWAHRVPTSDGYSKFHTCISHTFDEDCPICEYVRELREDPEADEKLIKQVMAKQRQLFNVVDVKDRGKGVQIWEISYYNFGNLLKDEMDEDDPDDDHADFFKLDGETLKLRIVDATIGKGKPYQKVGKIEFKARKKSLSDSLLDEVHCLDELVAHPSYDELMAVIKQSERSATDDDDDDDDDDDKSKGKKKSDNKKSTKGKKPKKETQDDDWDDDTRDDDDFDDDTRDDDDFDDDTQDDDDQDSVVDDDEVDDDDDDVVDDDDDGARLLQSIQLNTIWQIE